MKLDARLGLRCHLQLLLNALGAGVYREARASITRWSAPACLALLAGCQGGGPQVPVAPDPDHAVVGVDEHAAPEGRHYRIVPGESEVVIQVFRGGRLSRFGHNHVISTTAVEGDIWLNEEVGRSQVAVHIEKQSLSVDEESRRAKLGPEFAADVPDDAREGTRENMLGPELLDAQRFPQLQLTTDHISGSLPDVQWHARVTVRDEAMRVTLPLHVAQTGQRIVARGQTVVSHTKLGLQPFSVMLGALRVQEDIILNYAVSAELLDEALP